MGCASSAAKGEAYTPSSFRPGDEETTVSSNYVASADNKDSPPAKATGAKSSAKSSLKDDSDWVPAIDTDVFNTGAATAATQ